jgi:DNA topoisomerase-2
MKIEDKYKVLTQIEHVLLRPQTYVGSNKMTIKDEWIISENSDRMEKKEISYIPSFIKIFDEVITNSVDESKRENSKLNTIKVNIKKDEISVWDNGGIPVIKHNVYNQYIPEVIFGNLMSGSNYNDDEERILAGTNGLGAKLTNIFSKKFSIITCDGINIFKQTYSNNMRDRTKASIGKSKKNYTEITFKPDFDKFGLDYLDENHFNIIKKRVYDIAATNTKLKVYLNDVLINFKSFSDYIKLYTDDYLYESSKDSLWSVGISISNNGFQQISFVNSTETYDGGTHVNYILDQIITNLREFFLKKHKIDVKPSELKNHIFLFLNSTVINPAFSSQTKEKLITDIKDFGIYFEISNKLIQSILKSEIVGSVLDWIDKKKLAEENKLQRQLNKSLSKIKVEKLIDSKGKDRGSHSIGLFEGDSAISAFRKYRNPQNMGAFALKGKFINVSEISNTKLIQNKEVVNLMAAIGLKLGQLANISDLRYGKILFYVDADHDGNSIASLLINFFYKYWPELYDNNIIYKVETPIIVAIPKQGKKNKIFFYTQKEYDNWAIKNNVNKYELNYKKGLAALVDDEYKDIINNPKLTLICKDDLSSNTLDIWFGKNSELRKNELLKLRNNERP